MPAGFRSHRQVCSVLLNPTNSIVTPNLAISRRFHTELPTFGGLWDSCPNPDVCQALCPAFFVHDPSQTKHRGISGLFLPSAKTRRKCFRDVPRKVAEK